MPGIGWIHSLYDFQHERERQLVIICWITLVTNIETEHSLGHTFAAGFPISIAFHEARHYGKSTNNNQGNGFWGVCVQHRKTDPKVTKIEWEKTKLVREFQALHMEVLNWKFTPFYFCNSFGTAIKRSRSSFRRVCNAIVVTNKHDMMMILRSCWIQRKFPQTKNTFRIRCAGRT